MPQAKRSPEPLPLDTSLSGILALLADDRQQRVEGDASARKTEVLLADAGLSAEQIAPLLGKSSGAIAKSIQRARKV